MKVIYHVSTTQQLTSSTGTRELRVAGGEWRVASGELRDFIGLIKFVNVLQLLSGCSSGAHLGPSRLSSSRHLHYTYNGQARGIHRLIGATDEPASQRAFIWSPSPRAARCERARIYLAADGLPAQKS